VEVTTCEIASRGAILEMATTKEHGLGWVVRARQIIYHVLIPLLIHAEPFKSCYMVSRAHHGTKCDHPHAEVAVAPSPPTSIIATCLEQLEGAGFRYVIDKRLRGLVGGEN